MIKDFHKTAIVTLEKEISYTELLQHINEYAQVSPVCPDDLVNSDDVARIPKTIIFSENREEWIYAFFSVWQNKGIAVPVDASSTPEDLAYIINDCRPTAIWTSKANEEVVRKAVTPPLSPSMVFTPPSVPPLAGDRNPEAGKELPSVFIIDEENVRGLINNKQGTNNQQKTNTSNDPLRNITPPSGFLSPANGGTEGGVKTIEGQGVGVVGDSRVAVIIYTSGTTGNPKGVMLTYDNLWANMAGVSTEVPILNKDRRALMLLPVHHILPLMGTVIIPLIQGGGIAICPSMTGPDIMATLCKGKVGVFIGVPRLWQMLYTGIKKKIDASPVTRALFNICKKANNRTLSRIIFSSVRKKMGGHLDYCVSGGAALDREIGEGLRVLGLDVLEGYGMTETAPIISFTRPGDIIPGCVGLPLPSVVCKLIDKEGKIIFPSLDHASEEGELCAKGPNVMKGYYNRPEETAAVIDSDGFIHTGDLARFDEKGRVIITGRSKEIIVLSNGKNVQPNEIEFKLEQYDDKVKEAAVMQDGDMLRAIIVPQDLWGSRVDDREAEEILKREVLEPYNRTVENYKKLMRLTVYREPLPRTKLDKLQRFKLKKLIETSTTPTTPPPGPRPEAGEGNGNDSSKASGEENSKRGLFSRIKGNTTPPSGEGHGVGVSVFSILRQYIEDEKKLPVYPESHIETDLAFDSLDKVGLQGFIEQTFGTIVNADTMADFKNIQALADHISSSHTRVEVEKMDWHKILLTESSHLTLPVAGRSHHLFTAAFNAFFKTYNRLTVRGLENLPKDGPFILAPNHQSYLDGPLAVVGMPWEVTNKCYFYATEEHVNNAVLRYMASHHNIILMERRNLKDSILRLGEVLKQGKTIVIFPEGTRTWNGELSAFKKTFAILATELNVPIVPVCINGAFKMLPRSTRFIKPARLTVDYLPAVYPSHDKTYEQLAQQVKDAVQEKLKK